MINGCFLQCVGMNGKLREAVDVGTLCRSGRPAYAAIAVQSEGVFTRSVCAVLSGADSWAGVA
jgi:hypothetical protein